LSTQRILERAFSLAASGRFRDVRELERALQSEGFTQVAEHLGSRSLRIQLKGLMARPPASGPAAAG
jgi:hypothetical protein